ncbi:tol-pal system protein YbgF [candidate division WOR-3 bacterium]|nr:tol-pal system protein YbgF [candidate division WOR-3 bacterium]
MPVALFSGCSLNREYVRRGQVLDSLDYRLKRVEAEQAWQAEQQNRLRADQLTELEGLGARLDQIDARLTDLYDRLDRIGRKLGLGRGDITPIASDTAETVAVVTPPGGADPDKLYNTAYLDFSRGKYRVAVGGFEQFIELFPESENADNARYWIGECYYSLGALDTAETEFKRVVAEYPDGNKVPAAAYKLGLVYQAQGRLAAAKQQLADVVRKYPGTTEAKLAQDRLATLE